MTSEMAHEDDLTPCDSCGALHPYDVLHLVVVLPQSFHHEEESVLLCDDCRGDNNEGDSV